jgi:hypothetical protein
MGVGWEVSWANSQDPEGSGSGGGGNSHSRNPPHGGGTLRLANRTDGNASRGVNLMAIT